MSFKTFDFMPVDMVMNQFSYLYSFLFALKNRFTCQNIVMRLRWVENDKK